MRDNHLGNPLHVYKHTSGILRFYRWLNVAFPLLLLVALALFLLVHIQSLALSQEALRSSFWDVAPFIVFMLLGLVGLFNLRSEVRRVRSAYLVVCEQGLLLSEKRFRNRYIDVVRWRDIQAITATAGLGMLFPEYSLTCRVLKIISLSFYQDMEELIDQLQQFNDEV